MVHGEAKKPFKKGASDGFLFLLPIFLEIESELAQLLKDIC